MLAAMDNCLGPNERGIANKQAWFPICSLNTGGIKKTFDVTWLSTITSQTEFAQYLSVHQLSFGENLYHGLK